MTETAIASRPPLILLASDQEWAARSLESILGPNGYAVLRAYTARQAIALARTTPLDALIIDARLPDMSGIEACQLLRAEPRFSASTPIIVTTAGPDLRAQRIAAFQAGAWEYYTQPLDAELMLAKLATCIRAKRHADRVREESLVDELTGLYNMRGLSRRAREIGAQAQRRHDPVACVAIAPDSLPADAPESLTDEVIAEQLAGVIRRTGRVSDIVGRIGSSEFAIIAPATNVGGAARLVERVRENVAAVHLPVDGSAPKIQIRAGYHAVPDFADSPVDVGEILLRATAALRHVRASGDDERVSAFDALPLRRGQ